MGILDFLFKKWKKATTKEVVHPTTAKVEAIVATGIYYTLQEIGDKVGVTRERVRQIVKEQGLTRPAKSEIVYLCIDCTDPIRKGKYSDFCDDCGYRHMSTDRWVNSTCSIGDCDRRHSSGGYCQAHNERFKKHGSRLRETPILDYSSRPYVTVGCGEKDCPRPHYAKKKCRQHYNAFRLNKRVPIK